MKNESSKWQVKSFKFGVPGETVFVCNLEIIYVDR